MPDARACSGNGICLASGMCQCEDKWIGRGDFVPVNQIERDCAISKLAIVLLWSLTAISLASLLVSASLRIFKSIKLYNAQHPIGGNAVHPYGHEPSTRRAPNVTSLVRGGATQLHHMQQQQQRPNNSGEAQLGQPPTPHGDLKSPGGGGGVSPNGGHANGNGITSGHGSMLHGHTHLPNGASSHGFRSTRQYTSHAGDTNMQQGQAFQTNNSNNNSNANSANCCIYSWTMFTTLLKQLPFLMAGKFCIFLPHRLLVVNHCSCK
jgi:hypothetical protein